MSTSFKMGEFRYASFHTRACGKVDILRKPLIWCFLKTPSPINVYVRFLFGRRPNSVIENARFDSKLRKYLPHERLVQGKKHTGKKAPTASWFISLFSLFAPFGPRGLIIMRHFPNACNAARSGKNTIKRNMSRKFNIKNEN